MTKQNAVSITLLVDRSGSMERVRSATVESINAFVGSQKSVPGEASFSLHLFDSEYKGNSQALRYGTVVDRAPIASVAPLTDDDYVPLGGTPLLDAIGETIDRLGRGLGELPESDRPSKVLVAIVTDGQENTSTRFTRQQIVDKVRHQERVYSWEFVFLGANMDAVGEAVSLGIKATSALNFDHTLEGVKKMSDGLSNSTKNYRGGKAEAIMNFFEGATHAVDVKAAAP